MNEIVTWLNENRTWVFSGIGVGAGSLLLWFARKLFGKDTVHPVAAPVVTQTNQQTVNITVSPGPNGAPVVSASPKGTEELHLLLTEIQAATAVSPFLPRVLKLAAATGHTELETFAKYEISGWREVQKAGAPPGHRFSNLYMSAVPVNFDYMGWGGDVRRILREIETDTDTFHRIKFFWHQPLHELESLGARNPGSEMLTFTAMMSEMFKDVKPKNDVRVYVYGSATTLAGVVARVRTELLRLIIAALER